MIFGYTPIYLNLSLSLSLTIDSQTSPRQQNTPLQDHHGLPPFIQEALDHPTHPRQLPALQPSTLLPATAELHHGALHVLPGDLHADLTDLLWLVDAEVQYWVYGQLVPGCQCHDGGGA